MLIMALAGRLVAAMDAATDVDDITNAPVKLVGSEPVSASSALSVLADLIASSVHRR